jgi:ribosomal protein S18 acetylase RimI-like enzyme
MNNLIEVNDDHIHELTSFIAALGEASGSFRYFNKRGVEAIKNHIITLLFFDHKIPVGYGHLDKFDNEVWLGIAIIPSHQGKGIGNIIMDALLKAAKDHQLESIALTVDNDNLNAINLYLKKGFKEEKVFDNYTKYRLYL